MRTDGWTRIVAHGVVLAMCMLPMHPRAQQVGEREFIAIEKAVQANPGGVLQDATARLQRLDRGSLDALGWIQRKAAAEDELELAEEALSDASSGLELARRAARQDAVAQLLLVQANALSIQRRQAEAAAAAREALETSERLGDPTLVVRALCTQAWQRYAAGYSAEAAELLTRALETAQRNKDGFGAALALSSMGGQGLSPRASAAERRAALAQLEAGLKAVDVRAYPSFAMGVQYNIGVAWQRLDNPDGARLAFEQATQLANQLGNRRTFAANKLQLAMLELGSERFEAAHAHLLDAQPWVQRLGGASMQFTLHVVGASVQAGLDHPAEAQAHLAAAHALMGAEQSGPLRARYLQALADVQERSHQLKAAVATLRELRRAEADVASRANDALAVEMRTVFELAKKEHENEVLAERERATSFKYGMVLLALISSMLFLGLVSVLLRAQVRKRRYYSDIAFKDELTGLPNRRSIMHRARLEFEMAQLSQGSAFVAVADIDHFKRINDEQGHDAGDAALRAFSSALQSVLRDADALGRYGGEEFLLLTRQRTGAGVQALFERMQQAVSKIDVSAMGLSRPITFSMGAARMGPDLAASIRQADEALYRAKSEGRNCCRIS